MADGVVLTHDEAVALAWRLAARQIADAEWLSWEDVPSLDEQSWFMVSDAVDDVAAKMQLHLAGIEGSRGVNSASLHERAS